MPEVYENQNWVVNAVESEEMYRKMQAAGQVNSNELYLVQDNIYDKYDAIFMYISIPDGERSDDMVYLSKGNWYDLVNKYENLEFPTFLVLFYTAYADIEIRHTYSGMISLYYYDSDETMVMPVCSFHTATDDYYIGIAYDDSCGTDPVYYITNGAWR